MQITQLLQRVHAGDQQALNIVMPLVYDELKKLAAGHLRRERKARPLDTTALVHEAFLRLAHGQHPSYESRSHFYGIASRLMRQVLVDLARARSREKRSAMEEVPLTEIRDFGHQPDGFLLSMDEALERLGRTDPLKVQLVENALFRRHDCRGICCGLVSLRACGSPRAAPGAGLAAQGDGRMNARVEELFHEVVDLSPED